MRHILPVFSAVVILSDQVFPVSVQPFQVQDSLRTAECHLHFRIDLDANGSVRYKVRLIISKEYQTEAGCRCRHGGDLPYQIFFLFLMRR